MEVTEARKIHWNFVFIIVSLQLLISRGKVLHKDWHVVGVDWHGLDLLGIPVANVAIVFDLLPC